MGIGAALLLLSCRQSLPPITLDYALMCGPLDRDSCLRAAAVVASSVEGDHPGRRVVMIQFVNLEGHAVVILDDGTEIGWGDRLSPEARRGG